MRNECVKCEGLMQLDEADILYKGQHYCEICYFEEK